MVREVRTYQPTYRKLITGMTCTSATVLGNTRKAWVDGARGNTTPGKWFWQGNPIEGSGWGGIALGLIADMTNIENKTNTNRDEPDMKHHQPQTQATEAKQGR